MREIKIQLFHEHFPVDSAFGMACLDTSGVYMVIINADLPEAEQEKAFLHEMLHIYRDDFTRAQTEGVQTIEAQAHTGI